MGSKENTSCVLPFIYQKKTYCKCTTADDARYWCATATPFSWSNYGYCNDHCPVDGGEDPTNSVAGYSIIFDKTNQTCRQHSALTMHRDTTVDTCSNLCSIDANCWYFFHNAVNDCLLYPSCIEERKDSNLRNKYLKDGCETVSGQVPNVPCVFPFEYGGKLHLACTYLGTDRGYKKEPWCATGNEDWWLNDYYGDCSSKCPIEAKCKARENWSSHDLPCVFPFTYKGVIHYECIKEGLSKHWCPTQILHKSHRNSLYEEDYIESGRYGYCNSDCPKEESGLNFTQKVLNEIDCSCSDFIDDEGIGKCQRLCPTSDLLCCYVNQPTNCKKVRLSAHHFGEISHEPCKDENQKFLKYKKVEGAYCFPHTTEHSNILNAITECESKSSCGMFYSAADRF